MRLALRALARSPGYTLIALVTLALGIGVNTAMFSVVEALLFRSGPFPTAGELVQIRSVTPQGQSDNFSEVELREIRERTNSFASLTTIGGASFAIAEPGRPAERIIGMTASADFFATFGVQPMLGHPFTAEHTQPGRNNVVVLSHACWQNRYGGSPEVIGRTLRLDGETVEVIGVMPQSFDYRMLWGNAQFWRPLTFTKDQIEWRDYRAFNLIGRLKPAIAPAQVAAELAPLATQQAKEHPESYTGLRYRVLPLAEALMDDIGRGISWMLLGLSGFVLLIACANLANLQLARATAGGSLGLALAAGVNRYLEGAVRIGSGPGLEITIDGSILAITIAVSLLTGVLFGIVPAWLASRADMNAALKQQSRGSTGGRGHHRMRHALIVAEVTMALVLLGGAGVMQRGFSRFLEREAGWDTTRVLTADLPIPETRFDTDAKRIEFFRKLEERLTALPGVEQAALATSLPIFEYSGERQILTDGQSPGSSENLPTAFHVMITSNYFATVGIALVEGRLFAPDLKADGPRVIIVSESLAAKIWPGRSAIGQRLGSMDSGKPYWAEVIGVVRDVDTAASLKAPSTSFVVYKPLAHEPWSYVNIVVRSPTPAVLVDTLRRAVAEVDPDLPADGIGTVRQAVDRSQHNLRLAGQMLNAFALLGLLLAAVGIYGVISSLVAQRTTEFGIRLALGAQPRDVQTLVLRRGLVLTSIGLVIGLAGAFGVAWFLGSLMPRLASPDPITLGFVAVLLFVVALVACYVPARRATKVDPLVALRAE